eukprot:299976-Amphidinium_carterae.3
MSLTGSFCALKFCHGGSAVSISMTLQHDTSAEEKQGRNAHIHLSRLQFSSTSNQPFLPAAGATHAVPQECVIGVNCCPHQMLHASDRTSEAPYVRSSASLPKCPIKAMSLLDSYASGP